MWHANEVQTAFNGAGAPAICESAGTGRQARLRGVCQPTWEFKSPLSHQNKNDSSFRMGRFCFGARGGALRREDPLRSNCREGITNPLPGPPHAGLSLFLLSWIMRLESCPHMPVACASASANTGEYIYSLFPSPARKKRMLASLLSRPAPRRSASRTFCSVILSGAKDLNIHQFRES